MKSVCAFVVGVLIVLGPKESRASVERIEVPIGQIFMMPTGPAQGYDDNHSIQIVLDGLLPNGCYSISDDPVTVDLLSKQIHPRLFAKHRIDGPCADESHLASFLQAPVPYTLDLALGTLNMGDYKIVFPRPGLPEGNKLFSVQKARVPSIDNYPYASVSSVWIPDSVRGDLPIEIELTGSLTSSCSVLDPKVTAQLEGDVFVVSPKTDFVFDPPCVPEMKPFQKTVTLDAPGEGRYLIHVRSQNGHAVNRAFSALVPDPE